MVRRAVSFLEVALPSGMGVAVGTYVSPNLAVPWVDTHSNWMLCRGLGGGGEL